MAAFFLFHIMDHCYNLTVIYKSNLIIMKTSTLLSAITVLILAACTKENFTENNPKETQQVTITGNSMSGFKDIDSRASTVSYIPEDGSILFFSEGGVKANGDTLYYTDGKWSGLKDDNWYIDDGDANITAYYPIIHSSEDLYYENGELKDVVCYRNSVKAGEQISLSFNHIFAKFIINLEKGLNDTIKKVHVNIPQRVNNINLNTCEYTTTENNSASFTFDKNDNCKYEFFIPAISGMSLSFKIESNNIMSKEVIINEDIFERGYEYICNVSKNKGNGIYTTKDFIAFTNLINGVTEYEGKKLEDFYTEVNGIKIFNLYNNLSFTDEEALLIRRIGERNKSFDYIFEGNNHIIDNITLNLNNKSPNMGLFNHISESGIVRNLTISNCKYLNEEDDNIALLAGINYGIIDNCHIINGVMPYGSETSRIAGFVANNFGHIINCSVSGLKFDTTAGDHGIFTYYNAGNIMNCRIKNDLNKLSDGNLASIITTKNNGNIYNIFIEKYTNGFYGICHINDISGKYYNCILPNKYSNNYINTNYSDDVNNSIVFYSDNQEEYNNIVNTLNKWIDEVGEIEYPDITFRKWKTDPSDKVIFE